MSHLSPFIQRVQAAAEAEARGDKEAHDNLITAIEDLRAEAETPHETLFRMRTALLRSAVVRILIALGVIQAIAERQGAKITAAELAKETKSDEILIVRLLRMCTALRLVDEVGERTYAANPTTTLQASKAFDLLPAIFAHTREYIREHGIHQFSDEPGQKTFIQWGLGKSLFDYFEISPEDKEYFDGWMAGRRQGTPYKWHEIYPAAKELGRSFNPSESDVILVDIGGNRGHDLQAFKESAPDLPGRLVLQDLQVTFDTVDKAPLEKLGIELMPHDFFTPQPVRGARAYFMRNIIHDWSDLRCQQILKPIVDAMIPEYSSLLLDDLIVKDEEASIRHATVDITMLFLPSGMERTYKQWAALLDSVGLKIHKVWGEIGDFETIIEAKKK